MNELELTRAVAPVAASYYQRQVFAEGRAFGIAAARRMGFLRRVARIISRGDRQLAEDLLQEALIAMWELDPSRFDAEDERAFTRMLVDRMKQVRRREKAATREDRREALYLDGSEGPEGLLPLANGKRRPWQAPDE